MKQNPVDSHASSPLSLQAVIDASQAPRLLPPSVEKPDAGFGSAVGGNGQAMRLAQGEAQLLGEFERAAALEAAAAHLDSSDFVSEV